MKNLRKIIALFLFIFIAGIVFSIISINKTLHKKSNTETTESFKDTFVFIKSKKGIV